MLTSVSWLDRSSAEDIAQCTTFKEELDYSLEEDNTTIEGSISVNPKELSNNAQKKQICQNFSKLSQPESWFDVKDIKIWPLIVLKNGKINTRLNNLSIPQQMKRILDDVLEKTASDVGGIIEIELGYKSLKIKCVDISSRSRLAKFLKNELSHSSDMTSYHNMKYSYNSI